MEIKPSEKSTIPFEVLVLNSGLVYLKFQNVGLKISIDQNENRVLSRSTFVHRLNDLKPPIDTDLREGALTHLFLRRCLFIGDSGLWNILKIEKDGLSKELYETG